MLNIDSVFVYFTLQRNHNRAREVTNGVLALEIQSNIAYFSGLLNHNLES